jgi:hypothetical protein
MALLLATSLAIKNKKILMPRMIAIMPNSMSASKPLKAPIAVATTVINLNIMGAESR